MDTQSSTEGEFDLAVTVANLAVALGAEVLHEPTDRLKP